MRNKHVVLLLILILLFPAACQPISMPDSEFAGQENDIVLQPIEPPQSGTPVTESAAITADPAVATVLNMIQSVNAGDFASAAAWFADDAMIYLIGMPPVGMEIYRGPEEFSAFLTDCCTDAHFVWEVTPKRVENGVVYVDAKTWMDFTRQLGVAPNSWVELYEVEDDQITLYASTITEESLANFKPALREVMPEAFEAILPPDPSDEIPATEVTFTIADGTCTYSGPMMLKAGRLTVNVEVEDQTADRYAVSLFTLDEDKDMIDLMASTPRPGPPPWSSMVFLQEFSPTERESFTNFYVKEGLLYLICWSGPPDIPIGNAGPFVVIE